MSLKEYGIVETDDDNVKIVTKVLLATNTNDLDDSLEIVELKNLNSSLEFGDGGIGWWYDEANERWLPQSPRSDFTWDNDKEKYIPPLDNHPTGEYENADGTPGQWSFLPETNEWVDNGSGGG